jgi:hypothetical protein
MPFSNSTILSATWLDTTNYINRFKLRKENCNKNIQEYKENLHKNFQDLEIWVWT